MPKWWPKEGVYLKNTVYLEHWMSDSEVLDGGDYASRTGKCPSCDAGRPVYWHADKEAYFATTTCGAESCRPLNPKMAFTETPGKVKPKEKAQGR